MNSLFKKLEEATEAENDKEVYYWYGRFTILFIDFEPIEEETEEDFEFSDDGFMSSDVPFFNLISEAEQQS